MTKTFLQNKIDELKSEINAIACDFVNDYSITNCETCYLSDLFNEMSDNYTSVYYSEQYKYFEENTTDCESALLSMMSGGDIADYIKRNGLYYLCCYAGMLGEYENNLNELYEDEEAIKKILLLNYMLDNFSKYTKMSEQKLTDILEDLEATSINKLSEISGVLE